MDEMEPSPSLGAGVDDSQAGTGSTGDAPGSGFADAAMGTTPSMEGNPAGSLEWTASVPGLTGDEPHAGNLAEAGSGAVPRDYEAWEWRD